jgi:transcriptional regulator with XRE-family HTH domain
MSTKKNDIVHKFSGDALKSARKGLGLSQEEFAKPLGLTGGYISKLEKNERLPKEIVVQGIISIHRIRRDWLEGDNVSEPLTSYSVSAIHRALTPDQEAVLDALEGSDMAQIMMKGFLQLEGADQAQAYADFVKKWQSKK